MTEHNNKPATAETRVWRRFLPLALLLAGTGAFFAFGLQDWVSCAALNEHRDGLTAFIATHEVSAVVIFMAAYATAVAFSLPVGGVLTLAGGVLFGLWGGTLYVVVAATIGATALFLAARSAMGQGLRGRAGPAVARMEQGFRNNAMSYLLFLRLMPVFPFWLVNLVPAVIGIPLRTFVVATLLGIVPGSFIYVSVGNGLGALFEAGKPCDPRLLMNHKIVLPLIGLAGLALVPLLYKKLRQGAARERRAP